MVQEAIKAYERDNKVVLEFDIQVVEAWKHGIEEASEHELSRYYHDCTIEVLETREASTLLMGTAFVRTAKRNVLGGGSYYNEYQKDILQLSSKASMAGSSN